MKQIDQILHRISIFFYVFVGLFIAGGVYTFTVVIINAAGRPSMSLEGESMTVLVSILVFSLLVLVVAIWTIVLFIMLLVSIGKSITRRNIFCQRTVRLINRYAVFNTVLMVLVVINNVIISHYIEVDPHTYTDLISGASSMVMLLMFAQVLKIGYILRQEQELTI